MYSQEIPRAFCHCLPSQFTRDGRSLMGSGIADRIALLQERELVSLALRRAKPRPLRSVDIKRSTGLIVITGVLLLAFALGARGLNIDPIWADELSSVTHFGAFNPPYSPGQVLASLQSYSPDQAPLYFILGALWSRISGFSQFALRLPSALFGVLMIAALYRFAADVLDRRTAVVASFLLSTNAFVTLFFHDMRLYTLLMWLAIAHTGLYWRLAFSKAPPRLVWLLFGLSTCVLLYLWNLAAVLFLGLGCHHLLFVRKTRRWLAPVAGWCLGALAFTPYLPSLLRGIRFQESNTLNPLPAGDVIELLARLLANGFAPLLLPVVAAFAFAAWRSRDSAVIRLAFVALVMISAILMINWRFEVITFTRLRYFLFVWPILVMLFAFGLTARPQWPAVSIVFIGIWIVAGVQFHRSGEVIEFAGLMARDRKYPPLHEFIHHLSGKVNPLDFLIGFAEEERVSLPTPNSSNTTSDYYLQVQLGIDGVFLHASQKRYRLDGDVQDILAAHPHVLLAHDPSRVPPNYSRTLEIITEEYLPCAILVDNSDLVVRRYAQPLLGCGHEGSSIVFENGIQVLDFAAQYDAEAARVAALTWWDVPDESMLDEYNISLQIITPNWQNVRQTDRHLYNRIVPWSVIELATNDLAPGSYRLMLVLYHRGSGERMTGITNAMGLQDELFSLLQFTLDE